MLLRPNLACRRLAEEHHLHLVPLQHFLYVGDLRVGLCYLVVHLLLGRKVQLVLHFRQQVVERAQVLLHVGENGVYLLLGAAEVFEAGVLVQRVALGSWNVQRFRHCLCFFKLNKLKKKCESKRGNFILLNIALAFFFDITK